MTSILHPPRPPKKVAQRETKKAVVKQFLHKLGIVKEHPFSHLQSFHPPAFHALSQEEKKAWEESRKPKPEPKVFSIQTEDAEAAYEKKTTTLMRKKDTGPTFKKRIAPVDPKEFLKETTLPEPGKHAEEFLRDPQEVRLRKSLTPLERFAKESQDIYARAESSEWHEHEEQTEGAQTGFAVYEDDIEEGAGDFLQGSTV